MDEKNEIIVYIEKFVKRSKYVLFDFVDSNEFISFNSITSFNYDWEDKPTMIELINYSQGNLIEGTMYSLSIKAIGQIFERIERVEDSLVIGFRLDIFEDDFILFGKSISFNQLERSVRNMDDTNNSLLPDIGLKLPPTEKVIVRNIGQGSWNELIFENNIFLAFDFGTIYTTKKNQIFRLIGNRDIEYQKSNPVFILSHWDVDHYHFILGFQDNTIKSVSGFIYRSSIPNLTARKALGRFRKLNNNALIPLAAISPSLNRNSIFIQKQEMFCNSEILFFNASQNRSRNKSGIGLALRKKKSSVVFSGDYDYSQISSFILPLLNYECNHYLIVPHHGGNAGKFEYKNPAKNKLKSSIISVGKNPYYPKHPFQKNIDQLHKIGFKVLRTDIKNADIIINL